MAEHTFMMSNGAGDRRSVMKSSQWYRQFCGLLQYMFQIYAQIQYTKLLPKNRVTISYVSDGYRTCLQVTASRSTLTVPGQFCKVLTMLRTSFIALHGTWCYQFTLETKEKSCQWLHTTSSRKKKFMQTQSAGKVMATMDRKGNFQISGSLLTRIDTASLYINSGRSFKIAGWENYPKV